MFDPALSFRFLSFAAIPTSSSLALFQELLAFVRRSMTCRPGLFLETWSQAQLYVVQLLLAAQARMCGGMDGFKLGS